MKDFLKWLGVNDKVAKVVVWVSIFMICLIIINAFLESIGAPFYRITIDNLSKINYHIMIEYLCSWIMVILTFLSITLLVFRAKEFKKIFKYSILYLILNILFVELFNYEISQIFIIVSIILFCFFYSGKKWKYILYGLGAFALNTAFQGLWYLYKARFIDFTSLNQTGKLLSSIDFYLIIVLLIICKEIYLNKKGG